MSLLPSISPSGSRFPPTHGGSWVFCRATPPSSARMYAARDSTSPRTPSAGGLATAPGAQNTRSRPAIAFAGISGLANSWAHPGCLQVLGDRALSEEVLASAGFAGKTLPLPCVFDCLHGEDTAFALCLRLPPSWRRHCLCFVSSTAFMAKTLPFLALLLAGADEPQRGLAGTAPPGPDRRNRRHSARGLWCVSIS